MWPFVRFQIEGNSMIPIFKPGDRVLVWRWGRIRERDFIVFQKNGMKMMKQAVRKEKNAWEVRSKNSLEGSGSADFGAISASQIIGKVIWKYS